MYYDNMEPCASFSKNCHAYSCKCDVAQINVFRKMLNPPERVLCLICSAKNWRAKGKSTAEKSNVAIHVINSQTLTFCFRSFNSGIQKQHLKHFGFAKRFSRRGITS